MFSNDCAPPSPPRHCLYTIYPVFFIVIWTDCIYSRRSLYLYVRHIRHSSLVEFDSITAQISSHYLSAEYSLNVNVFLGRLHQCEILKNNPLIDNMNHQACVPSPPEHLIYHLRGNMPGNCLHAIKYSLEMELWRWLSNQMGFGEN